MMSSPARAPTRVRFVPQQYLTADALNAEQRYHLAAERRHRITAHDWGVVRGLMIMAKDGEEETRSIEREAASEGLVLTQGYAVDGFGRDLLVPEALPLDDLFRKARLSNPDETRFSVQLNYARRVVDNGERWEEQTALAIVPAAEAIKPEPLQREEDAPDDPDIRYPVNLGQLVAAEPTGWRFHATNATRREAGIFASEIRDPDERLWMSLREGFFLYLSNDPEQESELPGQTEPRLSITETETDQQDENGKPILKKETRLMGATRIEGTVAIDQALQFETSDKALREWSLSRFPGEQQLQAVNAAKALQALTEEVTGKAEDPAERERADELRLVLPEKNAEFVVAAWSEEDKDQKKLLTVSADGTLTVHGDLVVEGKFEEQPGAQVLIPEHIATIASQMGAGKPPEKQGAIAAMLARIKKFLSSFIQLRLVQRHPWLSMAAVFFATDWGADWMNSLGGKEKIMEIWASIQQFFQ